VLARRVNESAAELSRDHPGRFGFFAGLPLPDLEGSLVELDHACDVLHANGVVLMSNAGGLYPGEPSWEPLWRALNERSAVVLLHPTSPPQWRQVAQGGELPLLGDRLDHFRRTFAPDSLPSVTPQLENLWYDVAGTPDAVAGDRVLYGSDYCFTPADAIRRQLEKLDARFDGWRERVRANAQRLVGNKVAA
jgi:predicted TIM-barrel fold metal-dependent hydrolase